MTDTAIINESNNRNADIFSDSDTSLVILTTKLKLITIKATTTVTIIIIAAKTRAINIYCPIKNGKLQRRPYLLACFARIELDLLNIHQFASASNIHFQDQKVSIMHFVYGIRHSGRSEAKARP